MWFTNKGRALQAKAQAGTLLNFTRMAAGDGELGSSIIADLNDLKNEIISLDIHKLKTLPEGKAVVGTVLSNQDLDSGFYFRELGVFAEDPDEGEILYCYGNAGDTAEYIPSAGGADIIEKVIDIITIVDNIEDITAVIDTSLAYVTVPAYEADQGTMPLETIATQIRPAINEVLGKMVENLENTPGIISNVEANLPEASAVDTGVLFIASDTRKIFRSNAITWDRIGVATWDDLENVPDLVHTAGDTMTGNLNMSAENGISFGGRFKIKYNSTDDSLDFEVI